MKFSWFHLMPYRWLPPDFRERYHGVWVDVPNRLYDPERGHELYNEYLDMLEYAGQLGFDGLGVNEHHQNAYGMMPSPNLMAAALARRATDSMLLVLGNSIALYNPPIRVAEEFAMLDVMSGGRLIAGFPVGTSMDTNYCYGVNPATLRDRYREAHDLIIKAWATREPFPWNGTYTKLRYVNVWPRPIQQPHPPIWIPGLGSLETWDFCVQHDYNYSYLSFSGYKRAKRMMDGYWERRAALGADSNPHSAAFFQQVCLSDTDGACEREWWPHVDYFFNKCLHLYPGMVGAPGYMSEASMRAGIVSQIGNTSLNLGRDKTWKELCDERYIVAGSPATVRQQLEELGRSLRVGHLLHGAGGLPVWEGVLPLLARAFRVHAPLLPGFGQSTGLEYLEDEHDLFLHGFDVLEALGIERPYVVGESMGGWMAAEMAALRPKEVGRLALAAPVGLWRDEAPLPDMFGMMVHELVPYLFHDQHCPAAERMLAVTQLFGARDDRTEEQVELLLSLVRGFRTAAKFLFPIPERGLERRLWRITAPTLVVWGAEDRFAAPLYGRIFAEKIRGARLETISDAGHLIGLERPEPYAQAVVRWGR